jgi:hypothetical protein
MARIFDTDCGDSIDFAHLNLDWDYTTNANVAIASGVSGMTGKCLSMAPQSPSTYDSMLRRNLPAYYGHLFTGFRLRCPKLPVANSAYLCGFWDTGNCQIIAQVDSAGRITFWNAYNSTGILGSLIAQTGSGVIRPNVNIHILLDITFATGGGGSVTVYADSVAILTQSGITTAAYSASGVDQVSIHSGLDNSGNSFYFDDFYVQDTLPALIDQKAINCMPNGVGQYSEQAIAGSVPAATHYGSVNEIPPDDGVTFVQASAAGQRETYKVAALPANTVAIVSVTTLIDASTDASGLGAGAQIAPLIGDTVAAQVGTPVAVNTSWDRKRQMWATDPTTSAAWVVANWPNREFGHKRTT